MAKIQIYYTLFFTSNQQHFMNISKYLSIYPAYAAFVSTMIIKGREVKVNQISRFKAQIYVFAEYLRRSGFADGQNAHKKVCGIVQAYKVTAQQRSFLAMLTFSGQHFGFWGYRCGAIPQLKCRSFAKRKGGKLAYKASGQYWKNRTIVKYSKSAEDLQRYS